MKIKKDSLSKQEKRILKQFALDLFRLGLVTENEIRSKNQILDKIEEFLKKAKTTEIKGLIDHRNVLLQEARKAVKKDNHEIAYIFRTWVKFSHRYILF